MLHIRSRATASARHHRPALPDAGRTIARGHHDHHVAPREETTFRFVNGRTCGRPLARHRGLTRFPSRAGVHQALEQTLASLRMEQRPSHARLRIRRELGDIANNDAPWRSARSRRCWLRGSHALRTFSRQRLKSRFLAKKTRSHRLDRHRGACRYRKRLDYAIGTAHWCFARSPGSAGDDAIARDPGRGIAEASMRRPCEWQRSRPSSWRRNRARTDDPRKCTVAPMVLNPRTAHPLGT